MRLGGLRRLCAGLALAALGLQARTPPRLQIWVREANGLLSRGAGANAPLPVGSLQKPFVAEAWAATHPGALPPRFHCGPASHCWRPEGHGDLGLPRALAVSCNAYFRSLAEATPLARLGQDLRAAGFLDPPRSADEAIGLPGPDGPLRIRPADLLAAYARLVREPWPEGEPIRAQVLAGLRESALDGTAQGLAHRGFWAKTGTVPAADGHALRTDGLALAVDDAGWAILARLAPGTGREAAAALAEVISRLRPWAPPHPAATPRGPRTMDEVEAQPVRIRMFDLVAAPVWEVRNLGEAPVPAGAGWLGPGSARLLHPGDRIGPGHLELRQPGSGLRRRFQGTLACRGRRDGTLRLLASLALRDYVAGVVAAEAPGRPQALQEQLGAAVLRFLALGPRHPDAEVCDQTHCAWFIGEGPRLRWVDARHAVPLPEAPAERWGFTDSAWTRVLAAARLGGPAYWTAHCGGEPLSPHALWGSGDRTVTPCPRHGLTEAAPWRRLWPATALDRAFGAPVRALSVAWPHGTWTLVVRTAQGSRNLRYDDAHRLLAGVLGWDALPSPADAIRATEGGFEATGRGSGHRVGLCLGD
ncbi:MAG TPA: hypothetical protein VF768_05320 [Holophagaceae bacterium]